MRFGSELARGSGMWGGPGAWASLEGRGCQPGPLLSWPVALGHSGPQRLGMLLPRSVPPSGAEPQGVLVGQVAGESPWNRVILVTCAGRHLCQ